MIEVEKPDTTDGLSELDGRPSLKHGAHHTLTYVGKQTKDTGSGWSLSDLQECVRVNRCSSRSAQMALGSG